MGSKRRRPTIEGLETRQLLSTLITEQEPNDRPSRANVVAFDPADGNAVVQGQFSCRCNGDFFTFVPDGPGQVDLAALAVTPGLRVGLVARDATGHVLFRTQGADGVESAGGSFVVHQKDRVIIQVSSRGLGLGNYAIDLHLTPFVQPGQGSGPVESEPPNVFTEVEPNDNHAQANQIALGTDGQAQVLGDINRLNDRDFFQFTAEESGKLQFQLTPNGCRPAVAVRDAQGRLVFHSRPRGDTVAGSFPVKKGETYFVEVTTRGRGIGSYAIDLTETGFTPPPTTGTATGLVQEQEPNNTVTQANPVLIPTSGIVTLSGISQLGDPDVFGFTPQTGGVLSVAPLDTNTVVTLSVVSPTATVPVGAQTPTPSVPVAFPIAAGATYFLTLEGVNAGLPVNYLVRLTLSRSTAVGSTGTIATGSTGTIATGSAGTTTSAIPLM